MIFNWRPYNKKFVKSLTSKLDRMTIHISEAQAFINAIKERNWVSFELNKVNGIESPLIQSLQSLQETLKDLNQREEEKSWVANNSSQIAIVLQKHQHDLGVLTDEVLKKIVQCCQANQGGLFLLNCDEETEFLELVGMYAYGKRKYEVKKIELGSGLAGQVFLEGGLTMLTDVPKNYVKITSGLGEATPRCMVLIALEINGIKQGVLELAFFRKPHSYQIEFLRNICEGVARAIYWAKESKRTKDLLHHSESLSQNLKNQESELRQSLEKMQAIQEDMERKNQLLETSRKEIEDKKSEIENMNSLIESKIEMQKLLYETQLNKLRKKLTDQNQVPHLRLTDQN
jgi:hypothetical protein